MTAQDRPADRRAAEELDGLAADAARSYRALAHDLDNARDLDRGLDLDFARDLALDNARDLAHALALALAHDHAHDHARVCALARALARDHDRVRALTRALTRARDLNLALDNALAVVLVHVLGRALALARARAFDNARGRAHHLAELLESVAAAARTYTVQQDHDAPTDPAARAASRWAVQLSATAVRLLPPADRDRFGEEFHAELDDLAATGTGRRAQLAYALRLLTRAGAHRRALRAPHPGRERAR